jgi:AsmA protein
LSLNKSKLQEAKKEDKTDFTEMKISAKIANGIATSDDLDAKSPFVRLGGAGKVDIPAGSMDYLAKATVVNTSGGQDAKDLAQLKGLTIPVKINGPFDALKYDVQYGAIAGSIATDKAKDAVKDALKDRLGIAKPGDKAAAPAAGQAAPEPSAQDRAKEKLKGLLGR